MVERRVPKKPKPDAPGMPARATLPSIPKVKYPMPEQLATVNVMTRVERVSEDGDRIDLRVESGPGALTPKQRIGWDLVHRDQRYTLLYGGSRSGKTALFVRGVCKRAFQFEDSRHAILRLHQNSIWPSIGLDTFPMVMRNFYKDITYDTHRQDGFFEIRRTKSQIWLGGLDDKERVEKVLGREYATVFLNECSQIPYSSALVALTRLAQVCVSTKYGPIKQRAFFDLNPVGKGHWTHKLFHEHRDPVTMLPLRDPADYKSLQMNPIDNIANLDPAYIRSLEMLPPKQRRRFLEGEYVDETENALWSFEVIEMLRVAEDELPDMQRVVVAVDPSGAKSDIDTSHDEIGIVVAGLGTDNHGYLLADCTLLGSPMQWGRAAVNAYNNFKADCIVGEVNFGGAMVQNVIRSVDMSVPFREVSASRGKVLRAEPVSALASSDTKSGMRIHHVGKRQPNGSISGFPLLENELTDFTDMGYIGERSPNRADAYVHAFTELMLKQGSAAGWVEYYKRMADKALGRTGAPQERVHVIEETGRQFGKVKPVPTYMMKSPRPHMNFRAMDGTSYVSDENCLLHNVPGTVRSLLLTMGYRDVTV